MQRILPSPQKWATKVTAQAVSKTMASLVVLDRHLWLNLEEIRDAEKMAFLDSPVLPKGLFGPAIDWFAEQFSEAQKMSQALRQVLPKRSGSMTASRQKAPATQPAKPVPPQQQKSEPGFQQQHPRTAKWYPYPKRQGPPPSSNVGPRASKAVLIQQQGRRGGQFSPRLEYSLHSSIPSVRALWAAFKPLHAARLLFEQLFAGFGGRFRGLPVTKQRLSCWIVDAIALAYTSAGLQCPIGVRAHSTRAMAFSWAWSSAISIDEICAATGWSSPSTISRFYNLTVPGLQVRVLSV